MLISIFVCEVDVGMSIFFFFWNENKLIFFQLHCVFRGYFPILISTSNLGFFPHHWQAYMGIFQASWEQEKEIGKYFSCKFTSYSLFCAVSHCSSFFFVILRCYHLTACMY